ncbi:MAG: Cof-type HAD-IIB family hydrolase [Clostridiales bacterium]|nr:Cof-type HAD-IIB family hydrolase [Clostridiales bacterium]
MEYKVLFLDCDGTLLSDDKTISQENKKAIRYAMDKDVKVVLCSGRSYVTLRQLAEEVGTNKKGNIVVAFNGMEIFDAENGNVLFQERLDGELAAYILSQLKKVASPDIEIVVYEDMTTIVSEYDNKYFNKYKEVSQTIKKVVPDLIKHVSDLGKVVKIIIIGDNEKLVHVIKHIEDLKDNRISCFFSAQILAEILNSSCSKATGVEFASKYFNISKEHIIAVGDHGNDVSMIKTAGLGIATANAVESAKNAADFVTRRDNNNSAIAEVIYEFI